MTQITWDNIAVNFDRYVTPTGNWDLAKTALELAGLKPEMRFLDVASGSGALSLPAARVGAKVLAVDISPMMIDLLKMRAEEERLTNLTSMEMDGYHLELKDNSFDIAGSQFGVTHFPDIRRGLSELERVVRPYGTVFLVTFGPLQKVEFFNMFMQAVQETLPDLNSLSPKDLPLEFQVSDSKILQEKMEEAGLTNVRVNPIVYQLMVHSGSDLWKWVTSSNLFVNQLLSGIDQQLCNRIHRTLDKMVRDRTGGQDMAIFEAAVHIGIGKKKSVI